MNFFILFLVPFIFSLIFWPAARIAGTRFGLIDYPDHRKIHSVPTLKIGGFLIFAGYVIGILIYQKFWFPLHLSILLIFLTGVFGDKDLIPARQRLLVQALIALTFILISDSVVTDLGIIELPYFLQIPFTLIGIVGLVNAYNIVDGMNGLCSGLGIISLFTIAILGHLYGNTEIAMQALLFSGGICGFLIFNLMGRCFMGDAGSYMIGFMVSSLSVNLASNVKEISAFAFLLNVYIPFFDTLFTIWRRKRLHKDPLKPDKRHLHHILSRRYHSKSRSLIVILSIQLILSGFAILFRGYTSVLIILIILSTLFLIRLWFRRLRLFKISL
ncbi:MAG: glycosyltransferase family 4 protein [Thermodesulfovibrionales bacterium]